MRDKGITVLGLDRPLLEPKSRPVRREMTANTRMKASRKSMRRDLMSQCLDQHRGPRILRHGPRKSCTDTTNITGSKKRSPWRPLLGSLPTGMSEEEGHQNVRSFDNNKPGHSPVVGSPCSVCVAPAMIHSLVLQQSAI